MAASWLCVSMRFLDTTFHGRHDGAEPEWPPSPMRLFQALVASAGRLEATGFSDATSAALKWLERQPAPLIVAPPATTTIGRRLSVPNNAMDVVAQSWVRGNESSKDAQPSTHRTMKAVRPMWLHGDLVCFMWSLSENAIEMADHVEQITRLARSVSSLGWGVDLVVGDATVLNETETNDVGGERWLPTGASAELGLRKPISGSLDELSSRHRAFVARIGTDGFTAPPPLSRYELVDYRRATDPVQRPFVVLSLIRADAEGFRAFDSVRKGLTVAGMLRHATKVAAQNAGWDNDKLARCVLGHGEAVNTGYAAPGGQRFAFLPLPSVEPRGENGRVVGRIRRVMLTTFGEGMRSEMAWAKQSLTAQELINENTHEPVTLLSLLPASDNVAANYTRRASTWVTVTPVVLPGYDDPDHLRRKIAKGVSAEQKQKFLGRLADRMDALIRKSMVHAGVPQALADMAMIQWRKVGFMAGVDHADRYGVPDHIARYPRYHVRIHFRDEHGLDANIPGPLCIGAGRYFGLGLLVSET